MIKFRRQFIIAATLALGFLVFGFMTGWLASRRLIIAPNLATQTGAAPITGDAPESLRHEVLRVLQGFQDGYTKRDPGELDDFMHRLFRSGNDTLVLGTEPGEWIRGYDRVQRFIANDWANWGNVRLEVQTATVSAAGDVAWLATQGSVYFDGSPHPIRFTGVLTRDDGSWLFSQVQFQWDERPPMFRELFQPKVLWRLRLR